MPLDDLLDLPISRLWETAKKNHLKIGISIDSANGKSWLDSLDVWDGSPGQVGSTKVGAATLVDTSVNDAAKILLADMDDGLTPA